MNRYRLASTLLQRSLRPRCWTLATAKTNPVVSRFNSAVAATEDETCSLLSHFAILGVPPTFCLDAGELKSNYTKLINSVHPDRHTLKSAEEQDILQERAANATRAYQVLSNPHTRATHLLELLGRPLDESSKGDLVGTVFLMEVMEIREEIEETSGDEHLRPLLEENRRRMNSVSCRLAEAFSSGDMEAALRLTAMLQYWNRIEEILRDKMEV